MSVHRALGNDDILDEIFGCFQLLHISQGYRSTIAVSENYRRRVTLAHLARVCTVFYEPAVRTLWRRLSNISPLLNLLHSSVSLGEEIRSVEDTGWHGEYVVEILRPSTKFT
ncbi:hypothetical protein BC628DRAFT_1381053 [Trametes gibbosa]|nr:hypothetical protein BC628DRAFT_1381053 [Trametes gibbosa]